MRILLLQNHDNSGPGYLEEPAARRGVRFEACMPHLNADDRLPDDDDLHRNMLAYVSDYYLIGTATRPHGYSVFSKELQLASLDHALWFQRPFRVDEWLLYSIESPSASGARGISRGQIFRRDGVLAAVVAQEGVMRVWSEEKMGD